MHRQLQSQDGARVLETARVVPLASIKGERPLLCHCSHSMQASSASTLYLAEPGSCGFLSTFSQLGLFLGEQYPLEAWQGSGQLKSLRRSRVVSCAEECVHFPAVWSSGLESPDSSLLW